MFVQQVISRSAVAAAIVFYAVASSAAGTTRVWSGAANALWSNPANWGGGAPAAGDILIFNPAAANQAMQNDYPAWTEFDILSFNGHYSVGGNPIAPLGEPPLPHQSPPTPGR